MWMRDWRSHLGVIPWRAVFSLPIARRCESWLRVHLHMNTVTLRFIKVRKLHCILYKKLFFKSYRKITTPCLCWAKQRRWSLQALVIIRGPSLTSTTGFSVELAHHHSWSHQAPTPSFGICSELRSPFSALLDSIQKVIEVIHIGKGRVVGQYSEDKGRTQSFMVFRNWTYPMYALAIAPRYLVLARWLILVFRSMDLESDSLGSNPRSTT